MTFAPRVALFAIAASALVVTHAYSAFLPVGCSAPVVLDATTNVWKDFTLHYNDLYRTVVTDAMADLTDLRGKAKALRVANTGSFAWL
jgi:cellulose 1,4-beta-cellobiosidase